MDDKPEKDLVKEEKPEDFIISLVSPIKMPRFYRLNKHGNLEGRPVHPKSGMFFMEDISGSIKPGAISTKQNRYQRSNLKKANCVLKDYGLEIGAKVEGQEHLYEIVPKVKRVTSLAEVTDEQ